MNAEIITIGTELLLGEIVDTNAVAIARRLRSIGLDLYYMTTVGDNLERIARAVTIAQQRASVIITTGGLGPTVDDVTREAVAQATGRRLVLSPELLAQIEAFFARLQRPMSPNNRRQAYIPEGAKPIPNPVGTAPGFIVETQHGAIICLPGVPREMEYLMDHAVLPYLRERFHLQGIIKVHILRTVGIGESEIDARIADLMTSPNPTVGLSAHAGQTDVRVTAKAQTEEEAHRLLTDMVNRVRERLGVVIYGENDETVEGVVQRLLQERGWTLAYAGEDLDLIARLRSVGASLHVEIEDRPLADESLARARARELRERTHRDVALVVHATPEGQTCIAAVAPTGERVFSVPYTAAESAYRARWISNLALDAVRRLALTSPSANP